MQFRKGDSIRLEIKKDTLCELADETAKSIENVVLKTLIIDHNDNINMTGKIYDQEDAFEIFPNPAREKTSISYRINDDENLKIIIYNLPGDEIMPVTDKFYLHGKNTIDIDISKLTPGIYTCKIVWGNNKIVMKKIIVYK